MIKAVIFDFFGVLALRGLSLFKQAHLAGQVDKLSQVAEINDKLNLGKLSYDDYINELAKIAEVSRQEVLRFTEEYVYNEELLSYIKNRLGHNYKIGIISNAGADWVLKILGEENLKLFDDIILSYKVGFIKPDPEIYEMSAKNLGVKEEECVFVDDIMTYCQGAETVGMNTVWYQGFGQFKTELEKILAPVADN